MLWLDLVPYLLAGLAALGNLRLETGVDVGKPGQWRATTVALNQILVLKHATVSRLSMPALHLLHLPRTRAPRPVRGPVYHPLGLVDSSNSAITSYTSPTACAAPPILLPTSDSTMRLPFPPQPTSNATMRPPEIYRRPLLPMDPPEKTFPISESLGPMVMLGSIGVVVAILILICTVLSRFFATSASPKPPMARGLQPAIQLETGGQLLVQTADAVPVDLGALVGLPDPAGPMHALPALAPEDEDDEFGAAPLPAIPLALNDDILVPAASPGVAPPAVGERELEVPQDDVARFVADVGVDVGEQVGVGAGVEGDGEGNGEGVAAPTGEDGLLAVVADLVEELEPAGIEVWVEEEEEAKKDGLRLESEAAGDVDGGMDASGEKEALEQLATSPSERAASLGGFSLAGIPTLPSNIFAPRSDGADVPPRALPEYRMSPADAPLAGRRSPTTPCPPQLAVRGERSVPARRLVRPIQDFPYTHHEPGLVTPPRAHRAAVASDVPSPPMSSPCSPSLDRRRTPTAPDHSPAAPSPPLLRTVSHQPAHLTRPPRSPPMTMAEFGDFPAPPNGSTPRASRHSLWIRRMASSSPAAPGPVTPRVVGLMEAAAERETQAAERREVEEALSPGSTTQPSVKTAYDLATPRTRIAIDADVQRYAGGKASSTELEILCAHPRLVQPLARSNGLGMGPGAGETWRTDMNGVPEAEEEEENMPIQGMGKGEARARGDDARFPGFLY
ncbi:hypothetical protein C8R46DRAFT_91245 [Mycena filopes]|nr:hypothetical protein C8R46DRAFT_91245 [Mycena filopes]